MPGEQLAFNKPGQPAPLSFGKGINNRLKHGILPPGFVSDAVNVDLDDSGRAITRKGFSLFRVVTNGTQMWSDGQFLYYVEDGALYSANPGTGDIILLDATVGTTRLEHVNTSRGVYWSNDVASGRAYNGVVYPFSVQVPPKPEISAVGGRLFRGRYRVNLSAIGADGEESAISETSWIDFGADNNGIVVLLPRMPENIRAFRVYCSAANDRNSYYVGDAPADAATFTISFVKADVPCRILETAPFAPTTTFTLFGGYMICAYGPHVYMSLEHRYGVRHKRSQFTFPADVSVIAPALTGFYVCTDAYSPQPTTWWVPMTTDKPYPAQVLGYGALKGSLTAYDKLKTTSTFLTPNGPIVAAPDGQVTELTRDYFTLPKKWPIAESIYRETQGCRQIIFACRSA